MSELRQADYEVLAKVFGFESAEAMRRFADGQEAKARLRAKGAALERMRYPAGRSSHVFSREKLLAQRVAKPALAEGFTA